MKYAAFLFASLLLAQQVSADTVEFANGDRLQGKMLSMQEGKMKFDSTMLGEIEIPLDNIQSFSSDAAIEIHLRDGTVLQQQAAGMEAGQLLLNANQSVTAQRIAVTQINAINPPEPPLIAWEGRLSAGMTLASGNTESQTAYIDSNLRRRTEKDRITLDMDYIENRETDADTGEQNTSRRRYALGGHYDYFISERNYLYANVDTEKETTANLDLRLTIGSGVGYNWINTEVTNFDLEAGISWVNENFSGETEDNDYVALRTAWRYEHDFTKKFSFYHYGQWLPSLEDSDDQLVKTETGLRSDLTDAFFVEAKVVFDWDGTPAIGKDNEDITYNLGVGWTF